MGLRGEFERIEAQSKLINERYARLIALAKLFRAYQDMIETEMKNSKRDLTPDIHAHRLVLEALKEAMDMLEQA